MVGERTVRESLGREVLFSAQQVEGLFDLGLREGGEEARIAGRASDDAAGVAEAALQLHAGALHVCLRPLFTSGGLGYFEGEHTHTHIHAKYGLGPHYRRNRPGGLRPSAANVAGDDRNEGVNGKDLPHMTARQFHSYFRLNFYVGEAAVLNVLRGEQRLDIP